MVIAFIIIGLTLSGALLYTSVCLYNLRKCRYAEDSGLIEILRNVSAYLLLIDEEVNVVKTNYYRITGSTPTTQPPKLGNLLMCRNGEDAGVCGTHDLCNTCPVRAAIVRSFKTHQNFSDLEVPMVVYLDSDHKAEKNCYLSISGKYMKVHGKPHLLLTVHDISVQKKTQHELEIARLHAEQSDRMKTQFLANTSHELRTPLNAIVGFSELLAESDTTEEERQEYMRIIRTNNKLLLQLVNDTLDLSKIEAGTLEYRIMDVELNGVMQELNDIFCMRIPKDHNVKLIFERKYDTCTIRTDYQRLTQVMSNLLSNAIKFTKAGTICFGYQKRENEIYFYTTDTGIGISEKQQKMLFMRFSKINSHKQGVGIGLAISKSIVETLGGHIGIESQTGKGSTFWFVLPNSAPEKIG